MTNEERIEALRQLGYTEREAAFLCLVALHSGYFVRRQYNQFIGKERGGTAALLVDKTLSQNHCKAEPSCNRTKVYHLSSHPFYSAIGESDNRHRRDRAPLAVKAKLMGLDYVLSHRQYRYLPTERDKVAYFRDARGIEPARFPTKLYCSSKSGAVTERYFVDKYPIFLSAEQSSAAPVVSFCYVDEGVLSTSGFETYLKQYGALFVDLRRLQLVYVAAKARNFQAAERKFRGFVEKLGRPENGSVDGATAELLDYFELRDAYERKQYERLDKAKLDRFSRYMRELESPNLEQEYQLWKEGGVEALLGLQATGRANGKPVEAEFLTCRLDDNYELFGSFT